MPKEREEQPIEVLMIRDARFYEHIMKPPELLIRRTAAKATRITHSEYSSFVAPEYSAQNVFQFFRDSDEGVRCACADNQGGPCSYCMEDKYRRQI